ncbi:MAG: adenylyltransferase/cytidyltransferase family protein [Candidatus Poribacteria bacterium]|nr:adenylyltransferase/cytidyltransferase family protein [Candidatus Poribacteria bacterium]MDE0467109.1 adenylyltransferase/cytidyltransferase family protein [Candidatus Poribacteria bacterium]
MKKGLISGSFDLYHVGHVSFIHAARQQCDWLTCAVSTDEHIRAVKGSCRPIIPLEHRLAILKANRYIDRTVIIPGETDEAVREGLERIVQKEQPTFVFCGADRTADKNFLPIQDKYGFTYEVLESGMSERTSGIIERILTLYQGERI